MCEASSLPTLARSIYLVYPRLILGLKFYPHHASD
ncbi:hypothetical protein MED222_06085 [Vibrio sp. MED222]|nr:hypothetical protein MED222_06085 [Vibrio sp. MED222]